MADESHEDDHDQKSASLFKMPMVRSLPAVGKKSASAFAEKDNEKTRSLSFEEADSSDVDKTDPPAASGKPTSDKKSKDSFSPAEKLKESETPVPYKEPSWSGTSNDGYFFEALKNGTVIEKFDLAEKPYYVFGRLPSCDHTMDHPSLSRYHAIIQYRSVASEGEPVGWYLYDLDSTHGTWINKHKVKPRVFNRLRVGYVVKFGGSTRLYILQGPDTDQDEESELSVQELKEQRERQKKEAEVLRNLERLEAEEARRRELQAENDRGCSWGMDVDDAVDEDDEVNPFSMPEPSNEQLYIGDPKKSLRGFFEREGYDQPEYEMTDEGKGRFRCRVELPIDTASGEPEYVEVVQEGKKKDIVVACALEACRHLDRRGLLRQSKHESRAKKKKNWADADFYDSDDDMFLDRTGTVEKKREMRIQMTKKTKNVETYESLTEKLNDVCAEMDSIEKKLSDDKAQKEAAVEDELDELDAFMMSMKAGGLDTKSKIQMKHRLVELRQQRVQLERLVAIAKPCNVAIEPTCKDSKAADAVPRSLMVGKMKGTNKPSILAPKTKPTRVLPTAHQAAGSDEEEEEEEEEEEDANSRAVEKVAIPNFSITKTDTQSGTSAADASSSGAESNNKIRSTRDISCNDREDHIDASPFRNPSKEVAPKETTTPDSGTKRKAEESHASTKIRKVKAESSNKRKSLEQLSYNEDNENYAAWLPPSGQSGDGKTSLNEKFGY